MKLMCPYCGNEIVSGNYCGRCFSKIVWARDFWRKSGFYYNQGLKEAKLRNLEQAEIYLKKAVMLSKYNIEARNLLGLVYYETGNVGSALKEWIISQSLKKEDNTAATYIEEVQKELKKLEHYKEAISLYNKAISYARQKNIDMAIIRLKKAVSLNPRLVKARTFLCLCYMYDKQYYKANEALKKVFLVDSAQKEALKYYYELSKEDTEAESPYEMEYHSNVQEKGMSPQKVINRSARFSHCILYFFLGLISVVIVYTYLIIPSKINNYKERVAQLSQTEEELQTKFQDMVISNNDKIKELEDNKKEMESKVNAYEQQLEVFSQKEKLSSAQKLMEEGSYEEAAGQLYSVAGSKLDEVDNQLYEALKETIYPSANETLYNEGMQLYNNGDYVGAVSKLETILLYEPAERMTRRTLYYLGCSEMEKNNIDGAKKYFNKLAGDYEGSYEASQANRKLNDLES